MNGLLRFATRVRPHLPGVLLGLVLAVGLFTIGDYGVTTDEPIRAQSGDAWLRFLATGDRQYLPSGWLANFGAMVDVLGAGLSRALERFGAGEYVGRHAVSWLFGWLGLVGTYRLGRRVFGASVGVLALGLLVLLPRYYGAMFDNPKDIPFAATFVWAVLGIVRVLQDPSPRSAAWCGALAAVCTAVRAFGVVFLPIGALACLWPLARPASSRWRLVAIQLGCGVALTTALWPILWTRSPLYVVQAALTLGGHNAVAGYQPQPHLFLGTIYPADATPGSYAAVWYAITVPLPTLLLAVAGIALLVRRLRGAERRRVVWAVGFGALWVVAPLVIPFLHRVYMHNAVRHFLFAMPAMALLAAVALHAMLAGATGGVRVTLVALAVVAYGDVAATAVRLHPFEGLYFSRLVGGLRGATGRFDTAYYGETYQEAFTWLHDHAPAPVRVRGYWRDVPAYYAKRFGMEFDPPVFEYYVSEVRLDGPDRFPGETVHAVEREGVPLAIVVKVDEITEPPPAWLGPPWRRVEARDGRFDVRGPEPSLALSLESPRQQKVWLCLGYLGRARLTLRPANLREELPLLHPPLDPCRIAPRFELLAGTNFALVDLAELDREAGLTVHYEAKAGLRAGSAPGPTASEPP